MLPQIILGSQSPQRKLILEHFKIPFLTIVSHFDETSVLQNTDIGQYAINVSLGKSESLQKEFSKDCLIITADTVVYQKGEIFHKPIDEMHAVDMLRRLASKPHWVFTGVTVSLNSVTVSRYEKTELILRSVDDKHLMNYVKAFNTLDKCGGYSVQDGGSLIVEKINGCSYNVRGLPINTLYQLLLQLGINLWNFIS
ncbi:MAG: Maf family nucleotide pyrophosphatase [Victivallaceae bacterium]